MFCVPTELPPTNCFGALVAFIKLGRTYIFLYHIVPVVENIDLLVVVTVRPQSVKVCIM